MVESQLLKIEPGYRWPSDVAAGLDKGDFLPNYDADSLVKAIASKSPKDFVALTFLSKEYLDLLKIWIKYAEKAIGDQFVVVAADDESFNAAKSLRVSVVRVRLPSALTSITEKNPGQFNGIGMAIIVSRLHIIKFLISSGFNVIQIDMDALILQNPFPYIAETADIAFQRVVYFPRYVIDRWGFALCGGFVAFRSSPSALRLLDIACDLIRHVSSDQLALNLSLSSMGVNWRRNDVGDLHSSFLSSHKKCFVRNAHETIMGSIDSSVIQALPATTFWRHELIPLIKSQCVLFHPNTPKNAGLKLADFERLGVFG